MVQSWCQGFTKPEKAADTKSLELFSHLYIRTQTSFEENRRVGEKFDPTHNQKSQGF